MNIEDDGRSLHAIRFDVTDRTGMKNTARETVQVFGNNHLLVTNSGVGTRAGSRAVRTDRVTKWAKQIVPKMTARMHGENKQ